MLKRENLSDKLADAIGRKIIHNELKSGEILVENRISQEWKISRSPVRDALNILIRKRLVEKTSNGTYRIPFITVDYIENVYDAVNMFYQYSFSRATQFVSDRELTYLESITDKIEKSIGYRDFDIYLEGVTAFGHKILEIAHNPIIEKSARELMPTTERIQFLAYGVDPSYPEKSLDFIKSCHGAFLNREPQKAAQSFKNFANTSKSVLCEYFNDLGEA